MSIDLSTETPLSLSEAAATCPGRPNITTIWRWCLRGCRGVRLDSFVRGGRRFTTAEALERFIQATTAVADSRTLAATTQDVLTVDRKTSAPAILSKARRRQLAAESAFCKANGF